jgi:hypothetical protein
MLLRAMKRVAPQDDGGLQSRFEIQRIQVCFPFQGKHVFFLVIAAFAGRNQIIPGTAPATGQRNQMIHGQLLVGDCLLTIITPAGGSLLLPPAALAHFPGLGPFRTNLGLVHPVKTEKVPHPVTSSPSRIFRAAPTRYNEPATTIRSPEAANASARPRA